jgi:8-oxo-dGTP diphosphatase
MMDVVCLVLIDGEGSVLATQRPPDKRMALFWEFPGGKVDDGESGESALRREIREELHLELPAQLQPLMPVEHIYDFGMIRLIPFLARCESRPLITLTEHVAARWVTRDNAQELEWAPADLPILDELFAARHPLHG